MSTNYPNQPLSMVPGHGVLPIASQPGPGYVQGPKGTSVLSPSDPNHFRSQGFSVEGPWPLQVVDGRSAPGAAFDRVSPLQPAGAAGAIPQVYRPDSTYGAAAQQTNPVAASVVPSSEQTLNAMNQMNQQAMHTGQWPGAQPQQQTPLSNNLAAQAPMVPPQFQQQPQQVQQMQQPAPRPPVNQNGLPPYLFPQDVQKNAQFQQQPQPQPPQYPQANQEVLASPLGRAVVERGELPLPKQDIQMNTADGFQIFGTADAILIDDGEASTTLTMINPTMDIESFVVTSRVGTEAAVTFPADMVTNLALQASPVELRVRNTKMVINNAVMKQKLIVFALEL